MSMREKKQNGYAFGKMVYLAQELRQHMAKIVRIHWWNPLGTEGERKKDEMQEFGVWLRRGVH